MTTTFKARPIWHNVGQIVMAINPLAIAQQHNKTAHHEPQPTSSTSGRLGSWPFTLESGQPSPGDQPP